MKNENAMNTQALPDNYLKEVLKRCNASTKGPWVASIEGRDHPLGGESLIIRGQHGSEEDLYLVGGTMQDIDFVANARQDIIVLLGEIERLKKLLIANGINPEAGS